MLSKGFFTFAQNSETADYVRLAYGLALSLKHSQLKHNKLSIGITPGTLVNERYKWAFDEIIEIPWGDNAKDSAWKLENEWKSIWMSPYDETIKLDADMLFFSDISLWWKILSDQDSEIVYANQILNFRGEITNNDYYRKTFTINKLPNIYTGFNYFRKTDYTHEIFSLAKYIFWNWEKFFETFLSYEDRPEYPSTDVIFAIAMKILDLDGVCYTPVLIPTFTHMKTFIQGWSYQSLSDNWQEHISVNFTPDAVCKIGNHRQVYPLHYHVKGFLTDDMIEVYEKLL